MFKKFLAAFVIVATAAAPLLAFGATNLISNPSVESGSANFPSGWTKNHNTRNTSVFQYPVTGYQSARALQTQTTLYRSGDEGWYFSDVTINTSKKYTFSDYYKSGTAKSYLTVRYKLSNGQYAFLTPVMVPAAADWASTTITLAPPAGAVAVTVLHALESVGTLALDNFSLTENAATIPPPPPPPPPSNNLYKNPNFTATTSLGAGVVPANWSMGAWGAAAGATFTYPVAGFDDNAAAQVSVASYSATGLGQGAAEWFQDVQVVGGQIYTFSDEYKSSANTYLIAQWTHTSGSVTNDPVTTLGSSGSSWAQTTQFFQAPSDAKSLTVLHLLQSVGTLTTDNMSLVAGAPAAGALQKGVVTLTFDDGLATQYDNALPILAASNIPASFFIVTNNMPASLPDLFVQEQGDIVTAPNAVGTTWLQIYTDPTETRYHFSDTYTASQPSTTTVSYTLNGQTVTQTLGTSPAGTNKRSGFSFTLPTTSGSTVTPISISHSSSAQISISNPSLTEYGEGYMTVSQVQNLQSAGEEVGAHTQTHADLTTLSTAAAQTEIAGSRQALLAAGLTPVTSFAYPVGAYNSSIEGLVSASGMNVARSVDIGYNGKTTDKFALKSQSMTSTTSFAEAKSWIDAAIANKLWLIITIHDVDSLANLTAIGDPYGTTPDVLSQIVSYLASQQSQGAVQVKTVHDALPLAQ